MRYLLTGDEFNAAEALRIGLVQEVVEPGQQLTRATELAQVVSAQAPLGVRATLKSARLAMSEGEEAAIRQFLPELQAIITRFSRQYAQAPLLFIQMNSKRPVKLENIQ